MFARISQREAAVNPRERARLLAACLALAAGVVLSAAGCATTEEGDIPWNAPQPWEGAPVIPGMNN